MLIDFIAGRKTDLYKIAPIIESVHEAQESGVNIGYRIIYTGTKASISDSNESPPAGIELPGIYLDVMDKDSAIHTAKVLIKYEQVLSTGKPDITMIYGRNNGAMACTLAAAKNPEIRIAHIGSGVRNNIRNSGDEINGKIIDSITDYHFPIAQSSGEHLREEGVPDNFIFFVGNPVSDALLHMDETPPPIWELLQLQQKRYFLVNLENPLITHSASRIKSLLLNIIRVSRNLPVILPLYEENAKVITALGIKAPNLHITEIHEIPHLYYLARYAKAVITDTEHLQDETTILQTPCMTLFKSALRPDTDTIGFNEVIGLQPEAISDSFHKLFTGEWKKGRIPYLWDGKVSARIIATLKKLA